jgi:transcriptional regulator with XRE-family HTH domain
VNNALRAALDAAGLTTEALAAQVGVDPKTSARWLSEGRIPHARTRQAAATLLGRDVADIWPDTSRRREPTWLREWVEWEREALALRWYELAWVPGLLQTEAYARATLSGESLTKAEADELIASRIGRQAILYRERPPLVVAVIDESVIRRPAYGDRPLMAKQVAHLAECAALSAVQVHIVPASVGMYPGLGGPFILADLADGGRAAHVDSQAEAQIIDRPSDLVTLDRRWERIRGEALSRAQSLDLIREAARSWT